MAYSENAYATAQEVANGFRALTAEEMQKADSLLIEAALIVDAYNKDASDDAKRIVSVRMVRRAIGDGSEFSPMGATQGSMSALGYSQSWTMGNGSVGELYLGKMERKLLGVGDRIGTYSPIEELAPQRSEDD